jgi:hypothetical protein
MNCLPTTQWPTHVKTCGNPPSSHQTAVSSKYQRLTRYSPCFKPPTRLKTRNDSLYGPQTAVSMTRLRLTRCSPHFQQPTHSKTCQNSSYGPNQPYPQHQRDSQRSCVPKLTRYRHCAVMTQWARGNPRKSRCTEHLDLDAWMVKSAIHSM